MAGLPPLSRPRPPAPGSAPLGAPRHFAVPQFRKHLLRSHCESESRQPTPPPAPSPQQLSPDTRPFPAPPACRLLDSRRRSPGPAGAAAEEPPHGWLQHRPPPRLQGQRRVAATEARPELARRVGRAEQGRRGPLGGLVSRSLRPVIPLPWGSRGQGPCLAPRAWGVETPPPLLVIYTRLRAAAASQSGISTPGGAPGPHRSLKDSGFKNVKFAFSRKAEGARAWRRASWSGADSGPSTRRLCPE